MWLRHCVAPCTCTLKRMSGQAKGHTAPTFILSLLAPHRTVELGWAAAHPAAGAQSAALQTHRLGHCQSARACSREAAPGGALLNMVAAHLCVLLLFEPHPLHPLGFAVTLACSQGCSPHVCARRLVHTKAVGEGGACPDWAVLHIGCAVVPCRQEGWPHV